MQGVWKRKRIDQVHRYVPIVGEAPNLSVSASVYSLKVIIAHNDDAPGISFVLLPHLPGQEIFTLSTKTVAIFLISMLMFLQIKKPFPGIWQNKNMNDAERCIEKIANAVIDISKRNYILLPCESSKFGIYINLRGNKFKE